MARPTLRAAATAANDDGVMLEFDPPASDEEQIERAGAFAQVARPAALPPRRGGKGGKALPVGAGHRDNLVSLVPPEALIRLGRDLADEIEAARQSRQPWHDLMIRGIKALGFDRRKDRRDDPFPGSSGVIHPAFAQSCIDMQARTARQLCPPEGPARTVVLGERNQWAIDRADRVARVLNWQCTSQIKEWRAEADRLLMMVGPEGSSFKKIWYDRALRRPRVAYIPGEKIFMPYSAADEMTSPLVAEEMDCLPHEVQRNIKAGVWAPHDVGEPKQQAPSEVQEARERVAGQEDQGQSIPRHQTLRYYECQITRAIPGLEGGDYAEYLVTQAEHDDQVVAIYRHWRKNDPLRQRQRLLLHYKLFPWTGPYGLGLWHLIGGLGQAATGALRALLDSAMWVNAPGGFRLPGARGSGGTITRGPGQFPEINVPGVRDIRMAIMADPHPGPSPVLFQLLEFLVGGAKEFASIALQEAAEGNANTPVGTTLARVDEGSRVYSGVFQRLHLVQGFELEAIYDIDVETIQDQLSVHQVADVEIKPGDFGPGISIVPVSDPRTYSQVQRALQAQARIEMATNAAAQGIKTDVGAAYRSAAKAMGLPDVEELFPEDPPPLTADPFSENVAAMAGQKLAVGPADDHEIHLQVQVPLLLMPAMIATPGGQALLAHCLEHAAKGALTIQTAKTMASEQPGNVEAQQRAQTLPDPLAWYQGWLGKIAPAMQPPADPATERMVEVEKAKVDAERERTHVETEAKKEIVAVETDAKLQVVEAQNEAKLREIEAGQDNEVAKITADLGKSREANASKERIEAGWMANEQTQAALKRQQEAEQHAATLAAQPDPLVAKAMDLDSQERMAAADRQHQGAQSAFDRAHQSHEASVDRDHQGRQADEERRLKASQADKERSSKEKLASKSATAKAKAKPPAKKG